VVLGPTAQSFCEEFAKLSASRERMTVSQSRSGRRPISVEKLLKKDKDGTLFKGSSSTSAFYNGLVLDPTVRPAMLPKRRQGDVPTRDDTVDVKTEYGVNNRSTAIPEKTAMSMWQAMTGELSKLALGVSREEAEAALHRLNSLEDSRQSKGEIARGAIAGTGLGVVGSLMSSKIRGDVIKSLPRSIAAAAVPGMLVGAALPSVKQRMNEAAEKEKLRSHLGMSNVGGVRSAVKQTLGVG
jgi:hypothetical protein